MVLVVPCEKILPPEQYFRSAAVRPRSTEAQQESKNNTPPPPPIYREKEAAKWAHWQAPFEPSSQSLVCKKGQAKP